MYEAPAVSKTTCDLWLFRGDFRPEGLLKTTCKIWTKRPPTSPTLKTTLPFLAPCFPLWSFVAITVIWQISKTVRSYWFSVSAYFPLPPITVCQRIVSGNYVLPNSRTRSGRTIGWRHDRSDEIKCPNHMSVIKQKLLTVCPTNHGQPYCLSTLLYSTTRSREV